MIQLYFIIQLGNSQVLILSFVTLMTKLVLKSFEITYFKHYLCVLFKCALWDRICDRVFSYVVIEVVILFLRLPVIVFVIEVGIEVVTDNL